MKEVKASNSGNVSDINDAKFIQVKVDNANATYTGSDGIHMVCLWVLLTT